MFIHKNSKRELVFGGQAEEFELCLDREGKFLGWLVGTGEVSKEVWEGLGRIEAVLREVCVIGIGESLLFDRSKYGRDYIEETNLTIVTKKRGEEEGYGEEVGMWFEEFSFSRLESKLEKRFYRSSYAGTYSMEVVKKYIRGYVRMLRGYWGVYGWGSECQSFDMEGFERGRNQWSCYRTYIANLQREKRKFEEIRKGLMMELGERVVMCGNGHVGLYGVWDEKKERLGCKKCGRDLTAMWERIEKRVRI